MKATTKPWRSGHCNQSNPPEIHRQCDEHPRPDGTPCSCLCHMAPSAPIDLSPGAFMEVLPQLTTVTPTGVLITDEAPETDAWFAARREGITGTDLPKILGISKYGNALSVWLDKRGELTDDAGEAAQWGQILEEPVAEEWARRNGAALTRVGVLAHVDQPWIRASLDRLVVSGTCPDGGGPCGLEVKTRSAFKSKMFHTDVPDDVLAQTTWGLLTTGLDHMHTAVLIGGQELRSFRVDRDPKIEQYLHEAAAPVWASVLDGTPPEAHPDADGVLLGLLNDLYAHRAGDRDLDPDQAQTWLEQYREAAAAEKAAKALKEQAKAGLVQLLDDGDAGLINGVLAFTYRAPDPADSFPAAKVRHLAINQPEIYEALRSDGYITRTRPGPRFDLKEQA